MPNKMDHVRRVLKKCFPDQDDSSIDSLIEKDQSIGFAIDYFEREEIPDRTTLVSLIFGPGRTQFGFLWITNRRLVFAGSFNSFLTKPRPVYREFRYSTIQNVQFDPSRTFRSARITLSLSESPALPDQTQKVVLESIIDNERLRKFVDTLQNRIANPQASPSDEAVLSTVDDAENADFVARLERLNQLKSQGGLTEEEFQAAKRKLLNL